MRWKHGSDGAEDEREVHASAAEFLVSSATLLYDGGRMAFWRASVNAAEARKAKVASVEAVLKQIPPFLIIIISNSIIIIIIIIIIYYYYY